ADGFWSITVYNAEGYFTPNPADAYSVNSVTAKRGTDGSVTVQFGGCGGAGAGETNCLPLTPGWNYLVRLYRPRAEILDGTWVFPG
ncbi:carboxylesterase, partial [Mycobacterium sp. ITM-2017-0098]